MGFSGIVHGIFHGMIYMQPRKKGFKLNGFFLIIFLTINDGNEGTVQPP